MKNKKIESLKFFKINKIPYLPFTILSKLNYKNELVKFAKDNNLKRVMIRTDGLDFYSESVNNSMVDKNLFNKTSLFFDKYPVVFVMHPGNIYKNFHSLNILKDKDQIIIEVVGPGFIASDLNRNGLLHEKIILETSNYKIKSREIISTNTSYTTDINNKISLLGLNESSKNNSYLLTIKQYIPISREELSILKNLIPKLSKFSNNWVASMSFVDINNNNNIKPIFWDIYKLL